MSIISKRLMVPSLLTDSTATKYTVDTNIITKDIELHFNNTDTTATIGVTVYLVESGGTAGASNTFLSQTGASAFLLGPGESRAWGTEQVLTAGDTIQAKAGTTSKIAMFASGKEISQG
jgi:hypothetical protein